jgi:hypothetical protein
MDRGIEIEALRTDEEDRSKCKIGEVPGWMTLDLKISLRKLMRDYTRIPHTMRKGSSNAGS